MSHPLSSIRSPSLYICVCVLPLTYFRQSIHTAQKKKIPQYPHTPLSFSRFIPHSALLCSSSLPFSLPHCCFPPSVTSSPLPSLLFLTTRSFQSCLCPQDSFFLSISISIFHTLLSLSFSPPYISSYPTLVFFFFFFTSLLILCLLLSVSSCAC